MKIEGLVDSICNKGNLVTIFSSQGLIRGWEREGTVFMPFVQQAKLPNTIGLCQTVDYSHRIFVLLCDVICGRNPDKAQRARVEIAGFGRL